MNWLITFLEENKEWLFSGAAFFVLSFFSKIFYIFYSRKKDQQIKSGDNSTIYMAGRDINK